MNFQEPFERRSSITVVRRLLALADDLDALPREGEGENKTVVVCDLKLRAWAGDLRKMALDVRDGRS